LIRFRGKKSEIDSTFLKYLTETSIYDHFIRQSTIQATIQNVSAERYGELPVPTFSLERQRAIVSFLNAKLERLDGLLRKKERQLALLAEKRQALISRAVTRGLNSNAPTKPSGVVWLGDIPAYWQVKRIKYCFHFLDHQRVPLSSEERSSRQGPFPYYGASGIIDSIDAFLFDEPLLLFGEDGANLVFRSTPLAFIASGKYWVNNHAHILKPKFGALSYWEHALNLLDVRPSVTGSAQPKLTGEALGNIAVPAPPTEEQIQIGEYLSFIITSMRNSVGKIETQLIKLHEYRQTLITAAVTGRVAIPEEAT
jgi:type I restriction enzyme S subunit